MVLLLDTNILLDVLLNRTDFLAPSRAIFDACKAEQADGVLAAHAVTDIWFILRKEYSEDERRQLLLSLFDTFEVVGLDAPKLISALERRNFADFEDCLQDECAQAVFADYIVTRNKKDFVWSKIKALLPEEVLSLL